MFDLRVRFRVRARFVFSSFGFLEARVGLGVGYGLLFTFTVLVSVLVQLGVEPVAALMVIIPKSHWWNVMPAPPQMSSLHRSKCRID